MKRLWTFSFLFLLTPFSCPASEGRGDLPRQIDLALGDSLALPPRSCVLSNPRAVKALMQGKHLVLVAKSLGTSQLRCGKEITQITSFSGTLRPLFLELRTLTQEADGLQLKMEPKLAVVSGRVRQISVWIQLNKLRNKYPQSLKFQLTLTPSVASQLSQKINADINRLSLDGIRAVAQKDSVELETHKLNSEQKRALRQLEQKWSVKTINEESQVLTLRPLVEISILIAEIKKSFARNVGLRFPDQYNTSIISTENFGAFSFQGSPIDVALNAFVNEANGKVLANPKLVCKSGEMAKFLAGGELPIKVLGWKTSDIVWKQHGILLSISPLADSQGGISAKITTEVSLIDEGHKIDGIPGFLTNRIETHFDIRGEKTIALSGLVRRDVGRGSTGLAILSEIPILGELFKSRDFRENQTELVVFVTPRVISPENPPPVELPSMWHDEDN